MTRRTLGLVAVLLLPSLARAAPTEEAKKEARARFDRGLRLFDEGDKAGALAELAKAWALLPNPVVLYDLGLVHASMGHAVEAVDALDRVLLDPKGLSPKELAHAKKTRDEQLVRVGSIAVSCDVDGAHVELDNLEVARSPLDKPLRVTAGTHVIGVFATGRIPSRKAVMVAGGVEERVQFELAPLSVAPAQLTIKTTLPEVDVLANGVFVGTTPFAATLVLSAGPYELELRRRGYRTGKTSLILAAGGSGVVAIEPEEDPVLIASIGGSLEVIASEPFATVAVDGRARGLAGNAVKLSPGLHRVRVERAGFSPSEREVFIESGVTTKVRTPLEPTAETRLAHVRGALGQRTVGFVLLGSGVALGTLGAVFLGWNVGKKATAEDEYERILSDSEPGAGRRCDPRTAAPASCRTELDTKYDTFRSVRSRDAYGWIGVGVGVAAAITGGILLLRADDPAKYDKPAAMSPSGWVTASGGGLSISGTF